jgi:hypothetical protein
MSIAPSEIVAKELEDMSCFVSLVMYTHVIDPITQVLHLLINIVNAEIGVINYRIITTFCVEIETWRSTVMLVESVCKNLIAVSVVIKKRSPKIFHFYIS